MLRYCKNCQKEYDFKINSVADLEHLVCPDCGAFIDKDSKKPVDRTESDKTEAAIGKAYSWLLYVGIVTIVLCAIFGVVSFLLKWYGFLYVTTLIGFVAYTCIYGVFTLNFLFPVLGGIVGFFVFRSLPGFCLGMVMGMFARRILTSVIWQIISGLVKLSKKK
ncbi:MAG: hypothetical protein ACI4F4_00800 [Lachnospiraceae bacterium]